jgi:hypothetical protein
MTLLKPLNNTTVLIPYEKFFIQSHYQEGKLISEQYPGEQNSLFQLVIDPSYTSHDEISGSISPYQTLSQSHHFQTIGQQHCGVCAFFKYGTFNMLHLNMALLTCYILIWHF